MQPCERSINIGTVGAVSFGRLKVPTAAHFVFPTSDGPRRVADEYPFWEARCTSIHRIVF
jgi:hypothetical protein